jgi:Xaa-Pro aminopeptidase
MEEIIKERLKDLRRLMVENGLSAFLVNGSDPHLSEYLPDRWQTRKFVSGFTGSYGWLAITSEEAVLWTDSRYYLQYDIETKSTGIGLEKARLPETITVETWICQRLNSGDLVGFDGSCYSAAEVFQFENAFSKNGIKMNSQIDLIENLWIDRPALPIAKAFLHSVEWAGKTRPEKFSLISSEIAKLGGTITIVSALDDLCWTFNIRGADVECNPVVLGYGIIQKEKSILFVDVAKFDKQAIDELIADGVEILPYGNFYDYLSTVENEIIVIDPNRSNSLIQQKLIDKNRLIEAVSVPNLLKSVKNNAEISGMKKAMVEDGLALLDFQFWLDNAIGKEQITEYDVVCRLEECRSKRTGFKGISFEPIVGYKDHGAIVHLHVTRDFANVLEPNGVLLVDSGGQYEFGTTDTTRTFVLGDVHHDVKRDFTLALKGLIALSAVRFIRGTIGCHLDVLARNAMWKYGINYGHGTAHGVGSFLNVHEGPMSIRMDLNNVPICPGNVLSNEPGIYRTGKYGVRTENVMVCKEDISTEFADFYCFETLTLFPIDTRLIDFSLMNNEEINWLNDYHQSVLEKFRPQTPHNQLSLLERLTKPIE